MVPIIYDSLLLQQHYLCKKYTYYSSMYFQCFKSTLLSYVHISRLIILIVHNDTFIGVLGIR